MPALDQLQKNAVIWGSKGHAKVLCELLQLTGYEPIALFDNDTAAQPALSNLPLHYGRNGFETFLHKRPGGSLYGFVAIGGGHGRIRTEILKLFNQHGIRTPAVVHPDATVSTTAQIGAGSQVFAQAVVASEACIGYGCILNHGAIVDHETRIGDGVHLAPSATLCGEIVVEDYCFIATGATVLPRILIGTGATVAAGAVVTKNVSEGTTVVGIPASPKDPGT
ncbi:acetyltransferase [Roseibium sp.]|uniref:acetyltransferase n=1 Tax=Roseibium sp. TaxID=1936156 RepID=UPI003BB22402